MSRGALSNEELEAEFKKVKGGYQAFKDKVESIFDFTGYTKKA